MNYSGGIFSTKKCQSNPFMIGLAKSSQLDLTPFNSILSHEKLPSDSSLEIFGDILFKQYCFILSSVHLFFRLQKEEYSDVYNLLFKVTKYLFVFK